MHTNTTSSLQINLEDGKYSHCCIEKYGTAKKWMRDDFNLNQLDSSQISVFNKVKLNQLEGIPFGQSNPNATTTTEEFNVLIDGQFYKMMKYTVSSEQLMHGDLIHYVITEQEIILCNESRFDNVLQSLSNREKEVLAMFAQGHSMTRIAKLLFLSPHTIDSHRMNLCKKLNVKRNTELAVWAHKLGLLNEKVSQLKAS